MEAASCKNAERDPRFEFAGPGAKVATTSCLGTEKAGHMGHETETQGLHDYGKSNDFSTRSKQALLQTLGRPLLPPNGY